MFNEVHKYSEEEMEKTRQEALEEIRKEGRPIPAPGDNGYDELLDRACICMEMVDRYLLGHPAIIADKDMYRAVHQSFTILFDLYQEIGSRHL